MPTCLPVFPASSRKSCKLIALFLLSPIFFFGQSLTGLWTGALSNDSTTVRKDQSFEIVLTEYKGKVYGYSRSEFIVDDTLYYMVKRVKGTIEGDVCEVVDDEIMSYNFRGKLDKGIKVTSIFRRNQSDSAWHLDGTWKTNANKKYYSVTGKVTLGEEKDLTASKIFPHLEELKLANDIAFYKEREEGTPIVRMVKPEKTKTEYSTKIEQLPTDNTVAVATPNLERAETIPPVVAVSKPTIELPKTDTKTITTGSVNVVPAAVTKTIAENKVPEEEIVAGVTKPSVGLPKTDTKTITTGQVNVVPAAVTKTIAENKVPEEEIVAGVTKPSVELPKTDTKNIPATTVAVTPTATTKTIVENKTPNAIASNRVKPSDNMVDGGGVQGEKGTTNTTPVKNETTPAVVNNKQVDVEPNAGILPDIIINTKAANPVAQSKPVTETKNQEVVSTKPVAVNNTVPVKKETPVSVIPVEKKPTVDIIAKAALVAGRKSEFSQIVSFKADSLELSLYDNGEVDGDTVSIYMNGQVIMSKQGLKASAIKKTIYITPGNEDFTLVLFAENLGKYPPNTGLLVVHDGDDVYNLRFSSDYEKNAGIIFRRKK